MKYAKLKIYRHYDVPDWPLMRVVICAPDGTESEYIRDTYSLKKAFPKEYTAWLGMKQRCHDSFSDEYVEQYQDRGIRVHWRWRESFGKFLADMKPAPTSQHSLDRRNNNGPYSPSNCRWATSSEQSANRRPFGRIQLEYESETGTLRWWSEKTGLPERILRQRLRRQMKDLGLDADELDELPQWALRQILFSPLSHSRRPISFL